MGSLSLRDLLPPRAFELGPGLGKLVDEVLQPVLDLFQAEGDRFYAQLDPDTADSETIDAMLYDLGNPFDVAYTLPLARRRLLVRSLIEGYRDAGSVTSLRAFVRALTGIEIVSIISPPVIDSWQLGVDRLGDLANDTVDTPGIALLGGSPQFYRFSFQAEVDQALTDDERDIITKIIKIAKPAHTHFLGFQEP